MTGRQTLAVLSIYVANAVGAFGHLLVVAIATLWVGLDGYGLISLYLLAFAVPVALESAVLRRGVALQQDLDTNEVPGGLLAAWSIVLLVVGVICAGLLAAILFADAPKALLSFTLMATGVIDYVAGTPILGRLVLASASSRHGHVARIALVQSFSRYMWLIGLLYFGGGNLALLILMPLRRILECVVLRELPGVLVGKRFVITRNGFNQLLVALRKYGSIISWLLLGSEGIGLLIYFNFGNVEFGRYRAIFDLASKAWFVATIFPLVIYPHLRLVERGPRLVRTMSRALSMSFLGYLIVALLGLGAAHLAFPTLFPVLVGEERYFFGVLLGVAVVGHARLGLECLQAFGSTRIAASLAACFSLLLLGSFVALAALDMMSVAFLVIVAWGIGGSALAAFVDERALAYAGAGGGVRAQIIGLQVICLGVLLVIVSHFGVIGARA